MRENPVLDRRENKNFNKTSAIKIVPGNEDGNEASEESTTTTANSRPCDEEQKARRSASGVLGARRTEAARLPPPCGSRAAAEEWGPEERAQAVVARSVRHSVRMQVLVLLVVFCLLARAEDSPWRTVSATGRRYLHPPPVPHGAAPSAAPPPDEKTLHNSPIATNYYPSRKEPGTEVTKVSVTFRVSLARGVDIYKYLFQKWLNLCHV